jgi:predicted DsbA family dithiol-disulfide isomerase
VVVNWRYFSLEQVNSQQGPDWRVWEQPDDYPGKGLRAFWAAEAARRQGQAAFAHFHLALLRARHEERRDIADVNVLTEIAAGVGLQMAEFSRDLADRDLLVKLAEDHTFAAETLGVFGVPTLVFPDQQAVFVRVSPPPPPAECLSVFFEIHTLADRRRYVQEVKRPQKPAT